MFQDIRFGARTLLRSPGYTLIATLTLALGIGASIAMFTVMRSVLWRPLPYPGADRLVVIEADVRGMRNAGAHPGELLDLRARSRTLERIAMANGVDAHVEIDGVVERAAAASVSDDFLPLLGLSPTLGRQFEERRDAGGGPVRSVIISDGLWRRRFAGNPAVVGRVFNVNNGPREVIGVLPPGIKLFMPGSLGMAEDTDLWFPTDISSSRDGRGGVAVAHLKRGSSLADAQRELDGLALQFTTEHPAIYRDEPVRFRVREMREALTEQVDAGLQALAFAVAFVLLVGCVNVANLTLARSAGRTRELAVRRALGAGRARLVRQLLTESLLLAVVAGGAGLLLGAWGVQLLDWLRPTHLPRQSQVAMDSTVAVFSIGISLLAGVMLGILPAFRYASEDGQALRTGRADSPSRSSRHLQRGLVIAEIALSMVPLVAAGLMLRSFVNLTQTRLGFNPDRVLTAWMPINFRQFSAVDARWRVHQEAFDRIRQFPGVEAVSAGSPVPFHASRFIRRYGRAADGEPSAQALQHTVMPGYFDVVETKLLQGRDFSADDVEARREVIIIDRRIADALWPGGNAVGQRLAVAFEKRVEREVVGVTEPVRASQVRDDALPAIFVPYHLFPIEMALMIKTDAPAATLAPMINRAVQSLGTGREVHSLRPLADYVRDSVADTRFMMLVLAIFASAAILLAAIGLYGTLAYLTTQRRREFGIRLALGASASELVRLVAREGLALTSVGAVIGIAGGLSASAVMRSLLYGVEPVDPPTLIAVTALFATAALVACIRPAWAAGKVDPVSTLRAD